MLHVSKHVQRGGASSAGEAAERRGDGRDGHGASFVADIGDGHLVRFLVSDFGISWVESRNGRELVKLEGAEAIQELQRMADLAQDGQVRTMQPLAQAA